MLPHTKNDTKIINKNKDAKIMLSQTKNDNRDSQKLSLKKSRNNSFNLKSSEKSGLSFNSNRGHIIYNSSNLLP